MELQLDFISYISQDAKVEFTQTPEFTKAMNCLTTLLDASFCILTSVQSDKANYEYHLKSHVYFPQQKQTKHAQSIFKFDQVPQSYQDTIKENIEVRAVAKNLERDLFPHSKDISLPYKSDENLYAIPFSLNGELVGTLIYQGRHSAKFEQLYPAAYHCLANILTRDAKLKKCQLKIHTYQTVLDLMPQRVFWKNRKSVYLGCNKAFSDDASLPAPKDIVGLTDAEIFPLEADLYRKSDISTITTREHIIGLEEPQTQKGGKTIWLRKSKRPIVNHHDTVVGLIGTYDDITQLKSVLHELHHAKTKLEDRVNERTKELTSTNTKLESAITQLQSTQDQLIEKEKMAALGALVAGVSHEINTPIGIAVTGASQLEYMIKNLNDAVSAGSLSKKKFAENCNLIEESSHLILKNLDKARDLIRNFKMIAVDQSHDQKRTIHLKSYLHDVVTTMTAKIKKNNVALSISGDETLSISTFPGSLSQIVTNLIDNALEHGFLDHTESKIHIHFTMQTSHLKITFRDNGKGIPEDLLPRIFEPFFTSKRGQGGSGLGLSIVYNLVTQKLKGKVVCKGSLEGWTEFSITLPAECSKSTK